jgi:anaerobic selenocysteine-containing dehydrogenase
MLMTVRSEGQFNTVVYETEDYYRGQERRDVVLLAEEDMRALGLKRDDVVRVKSETGTLGPVLVRPFAVRQGAAVMYYPEANVLVPRASDPRSRTPAFKAIPISLEKIADAVARPRDESWMPGPRRQAIKRASRPGLTSC